MKSNDLILNVEQIHKDILNACSHLNISKWDISAITSKDSSVQVQNGEAKQLKGSQKCSISIRVWNNSNLIGTTSTSDLSKEGLTKAIRGAYESSKYGNKDETPDFSPLAKEIINEKESNIGISNEISLLINKLQNAEKKLLTNQLIDSVPYNGLSQSSIERLYLNSKDAKRHNKITRAVIYLYAKAQEKGRKPRSSGAMRIGKGLEDLDIESCIKETTEKTISHLNYAPIETGKYLVCFSPEAFLQLIDSFSSMFNARSILDGVSINKPDCIGETIGVPFLTIYDDGLHPSNIGSFNFDGEGTPTQKVELVKDGVIKNLIHSEATARKFGVKPTGHAGHGSKVSVSSDWLIVSRSESKETIDPTLNVASTRNTYILIDELNALHSGVKPSQGSFSLPFDGWLVKDGIRTSIEAATIAGDILKLLKNIVNIENNQVVTYSGVSPHVWVDELVITGEA